MSSFEWAPGEFEPAEETQEEKDRERLRTVYEELFPDADDGAEISTEDMATAIVREYGEEPEADVVAQALRLIDEPVAPALRARPPSLLAFDPNQERDADGKWGGGGGGGGSGIGKEGRAHRIERGAENAKGSAGADIHRKAAEVEDKLVAEGIVPPAPPEDKLQTLQSATARRSAEMKEQSARLKAAAKNAAERAHDYDASAATANPDHKSVIDADMEEVHIYGGTVAPRKYGEGTVELAHFAGEAREPDFDVIGPTSKYTARATDIETARPAALKAAQELHAEQTAALSNMKAAHSEIDKANKESNRELEKYRKALHTDYDRIAEGKPGKILKIDKEHPSFENIGYEYTDDALDVLHGRASDDSLSVVRNLARAKLTTAARATKTLIKRIQGGRKAAADDDEDSDE